MYNDTPNLTTIVTLVLQLLSYFQNNKNIKRKWWNVLLFFTKLTQNFDSNEMNWVEKVSSKIQTSISTSFPTILYLEACSQIKSGIWRSIESIFISWHRIEHPSFGNHSFPNSIPISIEMRQQSTPITPPSREVLVEAEHLANFQESRGVWNFQQNGIQVSYKCGHMQSLIYQKDL